LLWPSLHLEPTSFDITTAPSIAVLFQIHIKSTLLVMDKQGALLYIFNHIFLPPKLPQNDDSNIAASNALMEKCLTSLEHFQSFIPEDTRSGLPACIRMIRGTLDLRDDNGTLLAERLDTAMTGLNEDGTGR
jgi:hypothetical protein